MVNEQFDVVISNPPFSITVDRDTAKHFPKIFIWGEKIAESLQKKKKQMEVSTENLFIERWYQLLKPKGRLGVVLPESVFDTTANRYIRLFLYKYFWIKAVVSLPHLAFAPYTMTKTSLLFAQKKTPEEVKKWDGYCGLLHSSPLAAFGNYLQFKPNISKWKLACTPSTSRLNEVFNGALTCFLNIIIIFNSCFKLMQENEMLI